MSNHFPNISLSRVLPILETGLQVATGLLVTLAAGLVLLAIEVRLALPAGPDLPF